MHPSDCHWFPQVRTYTQWPQMPQAHGPFGKDRLTSPERNRLRGIPLFINVQSESAIREAHRLGGRALSYLSFMDTYVHTAGFENGTARAPWDPQRPQSLLIDGQGRFVNTPMDFTWRMWRYQLCNNTPECVEIALQMVHEQMRRGADGIFVDNNHQRLPCYGHGVPVGYAPKYRGVIAAIPRWPTPDLPARKSPETLYRLGIRPRFDTGDPAAAALPRHRHLYPGRSHDHACEQLLKKVRRAVRSYGPDKILVVNGGTRAALADGAMLESFLFTWIAKGPQMSWERARAEAAAWKSYQQRGGRLLALSFFGNTDRSPDEDGQFSFAAATLLGYLWSDYGTLNTSLGAQLRTLDLGDSLTNLAGIGPVDYRFFRHGLVAINDTPRTRAVRIPAVRRAAFSELTNLADGSATSRVRDSWRVTLPPHSGRIYADGEAALGREGRGPARPRAGRAGDRDGAPG